MPKTLSLIVAVSQNGVIGRHGQLPWHLSADLRRFKQMTLGHTLIMGRKTYESIGRPLPGRDSIVVSRQPDFEAPGCEIVADWTEALRRIRTDDEAFVIGGHQIFQLALPCADRIYWTHVAADVDGDVFFPTMDWNEWVLLADEPHAADAQNDYPFSLRIYQRRSCPSDISS
jgi:dihydrofolate reductase